MKDFERDKERGAAFSALSPEDQAFIRLLREKAEDTIKKMGELNRSHREDILDKVLENTSKFRVQDKFKALKNAAKSL